MLMLNQNYHNILIPIIPYTADESFRIALFHEIEPNAIKCASIMPKEPNKMVILSRNA